MLHQTVDKLLWQAEMRAVTCINSAKRKACDDVKA